MTEATPQKKLNEPLNSTSKDPSVHVKLEKENGEIANILKNALFKMEYCEEQRVPICLICDSMSDGMHFDIYTTLTKSSRCLLSDFITKTSKIMFERDKVWSNELCQKCYNLLIQLDQAETQFLDLKKEFLVVLNKNNNLVKLAKSFVACQTQTDESYPGKIEFCSFSVKDECDELSRAPTPLPLSDSDDEPLAGKKKEKLKDDLFDTVSKSEPIKCEIEVPPVVKNDVFSCRSCKLEFDTKAQAAVHAYSIHRIDVAKDPDIIKVKASSGTKESKKRKAKKKAKRKSFANMDLSDFEDVNDDEEWSLEKETRSSKLNKLNKKATSSGKVLMEPIQISPGLEEDIKPVVVVKRSPGKDIQKKLASTSLTIKKLPRGPSVSNPIPIVPMEESEMEKVITKLGRKTVNSTTNTSAVLSKLQSVGLQVKCDMKTEKRQYIKKQKVMLPCTECLATFSSQARLDLHMVKHAGSLSPYICEICGAAYKHKKACDIHVGMHKGISPWKCSLCAKIFPSKGALSRHEAIHTGTPNYQCDLCGKSFIHTSSFKMHKLSHSGLKPHSCSKCGLALMTRSHLKRHQRVHSGEKRHECTTCGKKFSERYNLYAHQKSHDPAGAQIQRQIKSHDCTVCDASFNRRYVLEKHMETAHQRVMDPGPKKSRNTMTKLLKQQAMQGTTSQDGSEMDLDIKTVNTSRATTPPAHTTDSTSSTLIGLEREVSRERHDPGHPFFLPHCSTMTPNRLPPKTEGSGSLKPQSVQVSRVSDDGLLQTNASQRESQFHSQGASGNNANNNSTSSSSSAVVPGVVVTKEEAPEPPGAHASSQGAPGAVVWQGLYQLANDYPLRMHGVDYMGYLSRQ